MLPMVSLIHADIFFFVTTIAVVVVASALTVALIYLSLTLARAKKVMEEIYEEAVLVRKDVDGFRTDIRREGFKLKHLAGFFKALTKRPKKGIKA